MSACRPETRAKIAAAMRRLWKRRGKAARKAQGAILHKGNVKSPPKPPRVYVTRPFVHLHSTARPEDVPPVPTLAEIIGGRR